MSICNADPDNHCCWIDGQVCEFLTPDVRCSLYDQWGRLWDNLDWRAAPVGEYFAERWGRLYDCGDWPQNIPGVMARGKGLCCWETVVTL